ncbi:enolase C-terminal domain-like protein [Amycolatopsis suaedae]|uniref:Mandelate racemase n=1 Tax=Amycolatopsis suaedae TaxID=2510978 RepID=A0A4Q7JC28_9PSEU|nr:enolase C-terminal domain-like protein [Amycolatopsis suaedae]RZQ64572.1 mandelate racemase [Amycolatopsis suaedae]
MTCDVPAVGSIDARAYRIPTPGPEADATLTWDSTTIVVVTVRAGPVDGLGWTYADATCVPLIRDVLAPQVLGAPVTDVPQSWEAMRGRVRNLGRPGLVSCALAAVDLALWDAAARALDLPLARLWGRVREHVDVYASGGFTTQSSEELAAQLHAWTRQRSIPRVKIKIGESWGSMVERDLDRVRLARQSVGDGVELYVDANGGYPVGQARRMASALAAWDVTWFEEPVSSDDLAGLGQVRGHGPDVAAGEYGYDLAYFARMVPYVDCLQIDITRCGGFTEWARVAAVAAAANRDVSAHCAPNLSAHAGAATANFRHVEWFADHDRIESLLFEGCLDPAGGTVAPSMTAPGHGLSLRPRVAADYEL